MTKSASCDARDRRPPPTGTTSHPERRDESPPGSSTSLDESPPGTSSPSLDESPPGTSSSSLASRVRSVAFSTADGRISTAPIAASTAARISSKSSRGTGSESTSWRSSACTCAGVRKAASAVRARAASRALSAVSSPASARRATATRPNPGSARSEDACAAARSSVPGADPNPNPNPAGAGLFGVCTSASDAEAGRAEAAALSGSRAALSGSGVRSISRSRPNPPSIAASRGSPARVLPSRCRTTPPRRNASSFAHVPVFRISAACAARLAPNAGTSRSIAEGGVPGSNARGNARAAAAARAYADCSSLNFSPVPRAFDPPPAVTSLRCLSSPPARRSYVSSSRSRATRGSLREHASASKTHCNSASTTPIVAPGERPWRIRSRSSNARARREGTRAQFGWSGGSARAATSAASGGGGPGAGGGGRGFRSSTPRAPPRAAKTSARRTTRALGNARDASSTARGAAWSWTTTCVTSAGEPASRAVVRRRFAPVEVEAGSHARAPAEGSLLSRSARHTEASTPPFANTHPRNTGVVASSGHIAPRATSARRRVKRSHLPHQVVMWAPRRSEGGRTWLTWIAGTHFRASDGILVTSQLLSASTRTR